VEACLSRKPSRKARAVEGPFGGQNTKNSSSALKPVIHVNNFLIDHKGITRQLNFAEYDPARPLKGFVVLYSVFLSVD